MLLSSTVVRYAGPAAVLSGSLYVLLGFAGGISWAEVPADTLRYALLAVSLVGIYLYLKQFDRFGWLGRVGFFVSLAAFALIVSLDIGIILNREVEQVYEGLGPVRILLLLLGLVLFGVGILRSAALPRRGGWLLCAAPVTSVMGIVGGIISGGRLGGWVWLVPGLCIGLGWIWLGYGIWSAIRTPDWRQHPVG